MARDVLSLEPHEYQERTADELYEAGSGICCVAAMGAGKTGATLMALSDLFSDGLIDRAIIFAPKRVAQLTWPDEAVKWGFPGLVTLTGVPPDKRADAIRFARVVVINYELAKWAKDNGIRATKDTVVILDEVSRMGEATGAQRKYVKEIAKETRMRWGLTGTPKGRDTLKMWGIADVLRPDIWGRNFRQWRARYHTPIDANGYQWRVLPGCEELIDEAFAEMSFRVDAPVYSDPILLFDQVELPAPARRIYDEMEAEMIVELGDLDILAEQAASQRMKLRQIAAGFVYDEAREAHRIHNAKIDALWDIAQDSGENLLVLYQFRPEIEYVREKWGYRVPVLGGETTDAEAVRILDAWNMGDIPLLLAHEAAMGHGLNMQSGGRRIVWMSVGDSLEQYLQTNARLARQGQTDQVFVHHLVVRNSLEEAMCRAHARKSLAENRLIERIRDV